MNLRERCQTVFQAGYQLSKTSFRSLARTTNLSKSSVHRLYHRIRRRNQHPESELWETEAGQKWLHLLVLATIFVFALQGGIGCERLSQFFHLLRLHRHIGVSPTALRSLRAQMESAIIDYQQSANEKIRKISSQVEVCAAADETFFDQVILVMLDLPSGYIFVEEMTENCQYETWQERVSNSLKPLGLKVKYLVSDRAGAIIKLALKDLGTHSIADLFHVLYDLNRSIAIELNYLASQLQKQLILSQEKKAPPELIAQIETNQTILQQSRLTYEDCCHGISTCLHPFDSNQNTPQTTEIVSMRLIEFLHTLQTVQRMQKALTEMNLQLHKVISDITGVTGLAILRAIVAGERNPSALADLKHGRIRRSKTEIAAALTGDYREEHIFVLQQELSLWEFYQAQIAACDRQIEQYLNKLVDKVDLKQSPLPKPKRCQRNSGNAPNFDLRTHLYRISGVDFTRIDGLGVLTVQTILSEVGLDPKRFPTVKHFTSWLGLCPGSRITGGKVKSSQTRHVVNRAESCFPHGGSMFA